MVVEIVINAEVLTVADSLVELHGELVATFRLHRNCDKRIAVRRRWHKLKEVDRGWIHASQRNGTSRKDTGPRDRAVICGVGG